ncbi:hypothetical protein KM1_073310 [Entamoeba histolytica HM-3:IMSS]|uniref:Transmembrane 9 superfamily member n=5 Tax=Entamoeba histolytica TaxID=5759 RepID=B1N3X9_ENTH1|nr:hypothetical protein EHI_082580 [Entamoeba histolytica HM-1:IMSS]EMD45314.1 Hypothetical protein EHI5A_088320 [Entamoeba histolytica KU27]EMS17867.1 hypothetical protein KM1_073310 [Entamoeba histolytica HM-3:IMSS]ENY61620.1 hypothetical protein EHI7A_113220 [Entamoeba histolytica HM-1:IMSS-A]GAT97001.1 hypothetical protein CL6EHI_082580 [Entamoeba histolytica]EDS89330.1 hypothetical protein EHI_082580 [Entamoeba histolytica HM-1:IMSS]|eukprot:XP_001913895.1 hypothetical protein EHI_082580 [Entamoeba histolytica HM-1:IMSS]
MEEGIDNPTINDIDNPIEEEKGIEYILLMVILLFGNGMTIFCLSKMIHKARKQEIENYKNILGHIFYKPKHAILLMIVNSIGIGIYFCYCSLIISEILQIKSNETIRRMIIITGIICSGIISIIIGKLTKQWKIKHIKTIGISAISQIVIIIVILNEINIISIGIIILIISMMTIIGYYIGNQIKETKQSLIPRPIQQQTFIRSNYFKAIVCGIIIFFVKLWTIQENQGKTNMMKTNNSGKQVIIIINNILSNLLMILITWIRTFSQLQIENYQWSWSSWLIGGSCGILLGLSDNMIYNLKDKEEDMEEIIETIMIIGIHEDKRSIKNLIWKPIAYSLMNGCISYFASFLFAIIIFKFNKINEEEEDNHNHLN